MRPQSATDGIRGSSAPKNDAAVVGRLKELAGLPIYQPAREADVLNNVRAANLGPLDNEAMTRLFERIIDEARRLERLASRSDGAAGPGTGGQPPDADG